MIPYEIQPSFLKQGKDKIIHIHKLRAQFIPLRKEDWADIDLGVSLHRGLKPIIIRKPYVPIENIPVKGLKEEKFSGFLSLGAEQKTFIEVEINK